MDARLLKKGIERMFQSVGSYQHGLKSHVTTTHLTGSTLAWRNGPVFSYCKSGRQSLTDEILMVKTVIQIGINIFMHSLRILSHKPHHW